jgi:hypothetical protein
MQGEVQARSLPFITDEAYRFRCGANRYWQPGGSLLHNYLPHCLLYCLLHGMIVHILSMAFSLPMADDSLGITVQGAMLLLLTTMSSTLAIIGPDTLHNMLN